MMQPHEWLLTAIAIAWLLQAALSLWLVSRMLRRLERPDDPRFVSYAPPGIVIVPFKGVDIDMADAVAALFEQDYPQYELLFVVESEDDPAHAALAEQMARHENHPARLLVAGLAPADTGQKVHNQLHALKQVDFDGDGDRVLFFLDSDAVPDRQWLRRLAGPLFEIGKTAVVTGYRWLVPAPGSPWWAHLAAVINGSAACLQGASYVLAWGGAMAMRVETARQGDLVGRLRGALTDDHPITHMAHALGRRVYFSPKAIVPSTVDFDLPKLFNFMFRQYALTRVYVPRMFAIALTLTSLYVVGCVATWAWLIAAVARGGAWMLPLGAIAGVFVCNVARSGYRRRIIRNLIEPASLPQMATSMRLDRWATSLCMFMHWLFVLRSAVGRTMEWRGKRYRMNGPNRIERIDERG
jgi:cellulose synthase/poly-beta-1,6-N-acetylglucosamine synthase-like glycosyltransferase